MLWHYSCIEELCPHFVRKNGFGVPKTIGITALFRFCGLFPLDKFKYMKLHLVCFRKQNIRKIVNILPVIFGC